MFLLRCVALIFLGISCFISQASAKSTDPVKIAQDSLRTIKRMEYKEGIPNGMLHAISLVETNFGRTDKYMPWPYTIRLDKFKSEKIVDVDKAFILLEKLLDMGYIRFDIIIDDEPNYSVSAIHVEDLLQDNYKSKNIQISARSIIKYLDNKKEAKSFLKKLLDSKWYSFKVGTMQLTYEQIKNNLPNVYQSLNTYDNVTVMVKQLRKIRQKYDWWESVGMYHSRKPRKSKLYVKNVWSVYQRVYKLKVK